MHTRMKGESPFYPGRPVPPDFFIGRIEQINRLIHRGIHQVIQGKPVATFVEGEYGIGKTSFAKYLQMYSLNQKWLFPIYVSLGGAKTLENIGEAILKETTRFSLNLPNDLLKGMKSFLSKYIKDVSLFGVTFNTEALKEDSPSLSTVSGFLQFLNQLKKRFEGHYQGIFLVLDEINGIVSENDFAFFLKSVIDTNSLPSEVVPLLLMVCGTPERRRELIKSHRPVERIFDIIPIERISPDEAEDFFNKSFGNVGMKIDKEALNLFVHNSAGYPKIMHEIGNEAFWLDKDGIISVEDAHLAIIRAAEEIGKKYVEPQVLSTIKSKDYQTILKRLAKFGTSDTFTKSDLEQGLKAQEKQKLNNFIQKLKKLHVIQSGVSKGEYVFLNRMIGLYIWLQYETKNK